nr:hypothetical protein CFP56_13154 [Quercus suber]
MTVETGNDFVPHARMRYQQPGSPFEVSSNDLPSGDIYTCPGNTMSFPSPGAVRARAEQGGKFRSYANLVCFSELGLMVKWGEKITIAEGQCLWFIRNHLRHSVPVPRIFGWKRDQNQTFLYLELVPGDTLADRWNGLNEIERSSLCKQLREMVSSWRQIRPCPGTSRFKLSQIGGQALRDIMFSEAGHYPGGPFPNVATFHDFFVGLPWYTRPECAGSKLDRKARAGLEDDVPVVFTHGDLDQTNILISRAGQGPLRIMAVIDWHQSGWYPIHWERLKAQMVAYPDSDWGTKYLPRVLDPANYEYFWAFEYVSMCILAGGVVERTDE